MRLKRWAQMFSLVRKFKILVKYPDCLNVAPLDPILAQFDVTNGNEDQTVTMPKIEMNSENFYFEHDKHPATSNIKEEPNCIKVSMN